MRLLIAAAAMAAIAFPTMASAEHRKHHHHRDDHASAHEWHRLVHRLKHHGFVRWEEAELKGGRYWVIDDAVNHAGHQYDLKLDRHTLAVIKKRQER